MNRTKKFSLNALTTALNQIIIMVVGFITPSLMISTYGSEINGLISSISQIISYLSLVEAGLSGAAVYSLYKPLSQGDTKAINGIVSAAKQYYLKTGFLFSGASLVMAFVYAYMKATPLISERLIFTLTLLLSVNGCVDFFILARYRTILTADQKTYVISLVSICQTIIRTAIIVFCATNRIDIVFLKVLALFPIFVKAIWIPWYCKRTYPYLNTHVQPDRRALDRRYDVIYQQILGVVQTSAPTMIATVFLSWVSISIYSVYNMVLGGINGVLSIFISGLPAAFGELIARKEEDNLRNVISQFEIAYYVLLSVIYGLTLSLIMPFISIYTRTFVDANYYKPVLAVLIVVNGLMYNIKTPQSMLIVSAGMYKETRWRVTIQGLIIVVGGCALVSNFGMEGIMIASIASNLYRTIDLLFYVPTNITHMKSKQSIVRMLKVIVNVSVIYIPSLIYMPVMNNYFDWITTAICYGLYALCVTILIWYATEKNDFIKLIHRFRVIFCRGK